MDHIKLFSPAIALALFAVVVALFGRSDFIIVVGLVVLAACVLVAEMTRHKLRAYGRNGWLGHR